MNTNNKGKVRKRSFGTTMGATSLIAILVILILVVFSTLSLITAKADLNYSLKTSDNIVDYYAADGEGENIIAQLSQQIAENKDVEKYSKKQGYKYQRTGEGQLIKFSLDIDTSRELNAEVLFDNNGNVIEKQLWKVSPTGSWEQDNQRELIQY